MLRARVDRAVNTRFVHLRLAVWLLIVLLAVLGRHLHNEAMVAASVPVALAFLACVVPAALRGAIGVIALIEAVAWVAGGTVWMIDLLPVMVAGFVGWLFARSLAPGRRPFIACAIAAIDGEARLGDGEIARYARRLTLIWALFQAALAGFGVLCVLADHHVLALPSLPTSRLFGAMILPLAVLSLFFGEFVLRRWLLPQATRHSVLGFLRALGRAWPRLIE